MGADREPSNGQTAVLARDTGLALVRITGEGATAFLNAQATAALDETAGTVRLSALADPKGRVLIVFHAWHENGGWTLALAASEVGWLTAQLARFVFRAQVRIAPQPDRGLVGLTGAGSAARLAAAGYPVPSVECIESAGTLTIAALTGERWLAAGEKQALAEIAQTIGPPAESVGENAWKRARFAAGEVEIRTETRGRYLPQMLRLDEHGAISFRKGCYPGQEVIARLQHRGQIKRKLALFKLDILPEAGAKIELAGAQIEILDSAALRDGGAIVQAVAPFPLPPPLSNALCFIVKPGDA